MKTKLHTETTEAHRVLRMLSVTAVFVFLFSQFAQAQTFPLQIQVNVLPPYSAYLQDYPGTGQQVRVLLINTSRNTYQVRLTGQLTGDNGIDIRTSAGYRPLRPVTVPPGQTLLSRNDLEGLFDLNQIEVTGIDKNVLARGFPLPDGTYQLCVRAYNETATNTATTAFGQPLSPEFPLGCSAPIIVRAVEPPILISPLCDSDIPATTPQTVVFAWTPPAGVSPAQVDYTLRIVELPQVDVDPNVFIDAIAMPKSGAQIQNLRTSTFLYGPTQPPLQLGKRYAWRVQAFDRSRKLNFLNDGKSPVCAFTYGPAAADTSNINPVLVVAKPPQKVDNLGEIIFCGQTIAIKKITNPDKDHFSGRGTLTMKSPVKLTADVDFADLVIRPLSYDKAQRKGTDGFSNFTVMNGKLESSLKGAKVSDKMTKLKTDKHTGGTAELTYQAIRLVANHTETFDEKLNTHTLLRGGTEEASIQTGLTWHSPITLQSMGTFTPGKNGFSSGTLTAYDGNLVVDVPGEWHPIESAGKGLKLAPSLKIPFGQAYSSAMSDLKDFWLTLNADSYFEIQNGNLKARLTGSLTVPSGRKDVPSTLTVPFQESDGITFQAQVEDPQLPLGVVDGQARVFLSFQKVNGQLGDLFEADDLPYPLWVKGISCPDVDLWMGRMVYMQDEFHPTSQDHLGWTTAPINPVVNRGKGYQSTNAWRKGLTIQTTFLGFKGKITDVVAVINESEVKAGQLLGQVYVPFIGAVGDLQILIRKYGLDEAEVISLDKTERTLLQTPQGDRVTVSVTGGYFEGGFFYPDMSISAYNETNPTRGIDARDIRLDATDVAITPKGELVSGYKKAKAEAVYGGSKQKTAYLNGLDYHLARVFLADEPGGKLSRLSFNGKVVLGEKIFTPKSQEQYPYDIVFAKPDKDEFDFDGTSKYQPINDGPKLPEQGSGFGAPKKGGGPYVDPSQAFDMTGYASANSGYNLQRAAPASYMAPMAAKKLYAGFGTNTAQYEGWFDLYTDDATYGNGFRLETAIKISSPNKLTAGATVIAGKAQGVKYWFAAFNYVNPDAPGIPLFADLEAYGFEGRIYSHMRHTGDASAIFDENYVPDAGTTFGMYAAMPIQSVDAKGSKSGLLLWGKTGLETTFDGFSPKVINIKGDVFIENPGGTGDEQFSLMKGHAFLTIHPKEGYMRGDVTLTQGNFGIGCVESSASLYAGKKGFILAVGTEENPITLQTACGPLKNITPAATGYVAFYATNGPVPAYEWLPKSGIGIHVHLTTTLIDLDTRKYLGNSPYAVVTLGSNLDLNIKVRPSVSLEATVYTELGLEIGYGAYSYKPDVFTERIQLRLPDFCVAYQKRICFPVLGGANFMIGFKSDEPFLRVQGEAGDMCFNKGDIEGPCEGILGWLMDGMQVIIDIAGQVLDTAYNLVKDATGAFVEGVKVIGGKIYGAVEDAGGAVKDAYCDYIGWGC